MSTARHQFPPEFKARVALEALKEHKTLSELSQEYGVHPTQIGTWKKQLQTELPRLFTGASQRQSAPVSASQRQSAPAALRGR